MDDEKRELAIEKVVNSFGVECLKVEQRKMLNALLEKKDCMAVLPTGFGKSLPYQMLVPLQRELGLGAGKVIVCSPLIALMQDQSQRLSRIPGLEVVCKGLIFFYKANKIIVYVRFVCERKNVKQYLCSGKKNMYYNVPCLIVCLLLWTIVYYICTIYIQ